MGAPVFLLFVFQDTAHSASFHPLYLCTSTQPPREARQGSPPSALPSTPPTHAPVLLWPAQPGPPPRTPLPCPRAIPPRPQPPAPRPRPPARENRKRPAAAAALEGNAGSGGGRGAYLGPQPDPWPHAPRRPGRGRGGGRRTGLLTWRGALAALPPSHNCHNWAMEGGDRTSLGQAVPLQPGDPGAGVQPQDAPPPHNAHWPAPPHPRP